MQYKFGEIEQLYDYFINLEENEQKYFLYLLKNSNDLSTIKDYVSRMHTIEERMSYDFAVNKGFHKVSGSRNFIACNGIYIINEDTIMDILKDIEDVYLFNKRRKEYQDMDIERRKDILEKFMEYVLKYGGKVIQAESIKSYIKILPKEDKKEFLNILRWYYKIKNIDIKDEEMKIFNEEKHNLGKKIHERKQKLVELREKYNEELKKVQDMENEYLNL